MASRLPRRAGLRFISISPLPAVDGGLELLTADGAVASRLQRAMRGMEMEFSLRVRGELSPEQQQAIRQGMRDRGTAIQIVLLEPSGGEASNRWYRLVAVGASGNEIRQLIERAAVTLVRMLRTRVGKLTLPRTLPRSHWRELTSEELASVVDSPGSDR
jgi:23S rRNA pseudouridine2605 synthase